MPSVLREPKLYRVSVRVCVGSVGGHIAGGGPGVLLLLHRSTCFLFSVSKCQMKQGRYILKIINNIIVL